MKNAKNDEKCRKFSNNTKNDEKCLKMPKILEKCQKMLKNTENAEKCHFLEILAGFFILSFPFPIPEFLGVPVPIPVPKIFENFSFPSRPEIFISPALLFRYYTNFSGYLCCLRPPFYFFCFLYIKTFPNTFQ